MLFISGVRLSLATKSSRCISIVPSIAAVVTDGVKGYQWPQWRQFQRVRTSKLRETYQIGIVQNSHVRLCIISPHSLMLSMN